MRNKKSRKISKCYFFWKKKKTWIEKNLEWIDYRRSSSLKVNKVINVNLCALNVSKSSDPVRLCESIDRHLSKKNKYQFTLNLKDHKRPVWGFWNVICRFLFGLLTVTISPKSINNNKAQNWFPSDKVVWIKRCDAKSCPIAFLAHFKIPCHCVHNDYMHAWVYT